MAHKIPFFPLLLLVGGSPLLVAQVSDHSSHVLSLPLLIDGAVTPDQIPDELAYHHFIMAIAERRDASPEELRRQQSRIAPIGLSKADADALVRAISGVREQLDSLSTRRASVAATAANGPAILSELKAEEEDVLISAHSKLTQILSADGIVALAFYMDDHVKRRIKIYGTNK